MLSTLAIYFFQLKTSTFYMRSLIWVHSNFVGQFLNYFFIVFQIEISYNTIQYLNCVTDQVFLIKIYGCWLNVLTFYISAFSCFVIIEIFHPLPLYRSLIFRILFELWDWVSEVDINKHFWYSSWNCDMIWMSNYFAIFKEYHNLCFPHNCLAQNYQSKLPWAKESDLSTNITRRTVPIHIQTLLSSYQHVFIFIYKPNPTVLLMPLWVQIIKHKLD